MKDKTFDYYLQEALKELEKPCGEFNSARCEWLLTRCCGVLLEGVNEDSNSDGKNEESKRTNEERQRVEKNLRSFFRPIYSHNNQTGLWRISRNVNVNETAPFHSFVGCSAVGISSAGSNGGFWADGSLSPLGSRRLVSGNADKSISLGRFHSNPPEGEGIGEVSCSQSGQGGLPWVIVDNSTEETVQVNPTKDPAEALAEALSKLTPGVKTSIWREE